MNLENFPNYINDTIVRRGRDYYNKNKVTSVKRLKINSNSYICTIEGTRAYKVKVEIDDEKEIKKSHCSCPYDLGPKCKHEVAAFYALNEILNRIQKGADSPNVQKNPPSKKVKGEPSYQKWKERTRKYSKVTMWDDYGYDAEKTLSRFYKKIEQYTQYDEKKSLIFTFAATYSALDCFADLDSRGQIYGYYSAAVKRENRDELFNNMLAYTGEMLSYPELFEHEFYQKIADELSYFMFDDYPHELMIKLYLHVWSYVSVEKRATEVKQLQRRKNSHLSAVLQLFHMTLEGISTEEFVLQLHKLDSDDSYRTEMLMLERYAFLEQWEYSLELVKWLLKMVRYDSGSDDEVEYQAFRKIGVSITALIRQNCSMFSDELYEEILQHFLPVTLDMYQNKLFNDENYAVWIDLLISQDVQVTVSCKHQVKAVAKIAPDLLLPVYHREVEYEISNKTRDAYKDAVKILKKLRTIYKKLNRIDEWSHYCNLIERKYSRLRALQEELRKGKIIE